MVNLTEINNHTDFTAGTTFLINKPITWTSFDVVKKIRNTIILSKNIKKIKIKLKIKKFLINIKYF